MKTWFPAFLIAVVLTLTQGFAGAEQAAKVPRIGYLGVNDPSSPLFESFRQGLRELGYLEGQNIIIEPRISEESKFRDLAADLVRLKMDVIVAQPAAIRAAMSATTTIPIVTIFPGDPVLNGFVASLERPGGNVTGSKWFNRRVGWKMAGTDKGDNSKRKAGGGFLE